MTANKDLKNLIRSRKAKTGESYTSARQHILRGQESTADASSERTVTAMVLKLGINSMRIRIVGETSTITLRGSDHGLLHVAPGQLIVARLNKTWIWRGDAYASGSIERVWTDVPALGLEPLPLMDDGLFDISAMYEPFVVPDPYTPMWEFFASTPRHAFRFGDIAWDIPGDHPDSFLVADAAELMHADPQAARDMLMDALLTDLRCIDAHVHLGHLEFDRRPAAAKVHFEVAIGIGELSLGANFAAMLPWGYMENRAFLRALHGYGLCLWRLGQLHDARVVFERALALNPADNQGIRECWYDARDGRPWPGDDDEDEYEHGYDMPSGSLPV